MSPGIPKQEPNYEPPSCYSSEPYPGDGREYPDFDKKKVTTINYTFGMYSEEQARYAAEQLGRVVGYQKNVHKKFYTYKVVIK